MTERKPHPDNELIDSLEQGSGGSTAQNDRWGGNLARDVGTRSEERSLEGNLVGEEVDRVKGSDNPARDELKGEKTIASMPTSGD
ncbi:hypothetical protein GCM10011515_13940 [Tsuneonella deserti]|uniref:Uncharacterized protein n=1 Tax=Tsuneonella deserti TaxID=2035528 RepID=A0ABQ1S7Z2_9SPHN|nr:hypothetical protein [Tsuneonella deserti]GGD95311.1 hypothetical protein GCM10011515_13940 [Tsuneonella deserti]